VVRDSKSLPFLLFGLCVARLNVIKEEDEYHNEIASSNILWMSRIFMSSLNQLCPVKLLSVSRCAVACEVGQSGFVNFFTVKRSLDMLQTQ
jgi:hypothetical protein